VVKAATAQRHERTSELLATDVGQRIRAVRLERGLSLAQLGGDDLSRSFLSLVELGRSRISLRALAIVAQRLDQPISYFLDGAADSADARAELLLDQAEASLREQEPGRAEQLLRDIEVPNSLRGRALWLTGWSCADRGRPRDAVPLLQEALALVDADGDARQLVQILYTLAMAFYATHLYDEAMRYTRRAYDEAAEHLEDDALIGRLTVCLGHLYYIQAQFDQAEAHYDHARQLFGAVNDLDNMAAVYSGLSRVWEQRGDLPQAVRYSRMGLAILELRHYRRDAARELSYIAERMQALGKPDAALADATMAIARAQESGARDVEAVARSTRAAIALSRGDIEQATRDAERADALAGDAPTHARIETWIVLSKLAAQRKDDETGDALLLRALDALRESGHHTRFAEIALEHSLALRERGDTEGALNFALEAAQVRTGANA